MPDPDLSHMQALIADDRADVRGMLSDRLREMGVVHIDAMAAGIGGTNLVALMSRNAVTPHGSGARPDEPLADAVSRFAHDAASPLMCVLALSGLLVREAQHGDRTIDDLKRIQAAAQEIAVMVRALGERATPGGAVRQSRSS